MIKNLYATHHFLGLMLSRTLLIFTASGSFFNGSLDKSSPASKHFFLNVFGYAAFNRNAAFNLVPVIANHGFNNKIMR